MRRVFEADSCNTVWSHAATELLDEDHPKQSSRNGPTREILHAMLIVHDPRNRWVVTRQPALNPAFAIVEVIWILAGRRDAAPLNFFNRGLPRFTGSNAHLHGAYGYRLRQHFGLDQLERIYQVLRHNPHSRQATLQIWDPSVDLPDDQGQPRDADIPCNVLSLPKIRDGKLEWLQVLRSNDLFLGTPYNFIQFTTLQEVLAGWLDARVGQYVHIADSLHVYEHDMRLLSRSPITAAPNTDDLALGFDDSMRVFGELSTALNELIANPTEPRRLQQIRQHLAVPQAYADLFAIVIAEAARRGGHHEDANEYANSCRNPVLQQVWSLWKARISDRRA